MSTDANPITIAVIGTCDTKLPELLYLHTHLSHLSSLLPSSATPITPILIDVGLTPTTDPKISTSILSLLPSPPTEVQNRNDLIPSISTALKEHLLSLHSQKKLHGLIAIGGSCGSSIVAESLQALPFGFPKLLVSTMASGDISPYIGASDATVMYSVVDVAGLNSLLKTVLRNAAGAIGGMVAAASALPKPEEEEAPAEEEKTFTGPKIAITMFGVTTPGCMAAKAYLEEHAQAEVVIFHATGSGGKAMESLILAGEFAGVLDLTTTELIDEVAGGILSAGPDRLTAAVKKGVPTVISFGAVDCINFGPRNTVPEWYRHYRTVEHNSAVTLVRSGQEELKKLAELMVAKRVRANLPEGGEKKVQFWIPARGVSSLSTGVGKFEDRGTDLTLFAEVQKFARWDLPKLTVVEKKLDINNKEFAEGAAAALLEMMDLK